MTKLIYSNLLAINLVVSQLRSSCRSSSSRFPLPTQQSRSFLTQLRREAQALKEQPVSQSAPLPKSGKPLNSTLSLTNLPYFVRRTGSNQLPVYLVTKAGGTKQLTKIQKTEGDLDAFRNDLAISLGIDTRSPDVSINRLTGHIIVKVGLQFSRQIAKSDSNSMNVVLIFTFLHRAGANPRLSNFFRNGIFKNRSVPSDIRR